MVDELLFNLIILNGENLRNFIKIGTGNVCPLSPLLSKIVLETLTIAISKRSKSKV